MEKRTENKFKQVNKVEGFIKIYVVNLGKYNEGCQVGEWLTLPTDLDYFHDEFLPSIGIDGVNYEEYAIHDYETEIIGVEIKEYSSIKKLNEIAELFEGLEGYEIKELNLISENLGNYGIEQSFEIWKNRDFNILYNVDNQYDLGHAYIEDVYGGVEQLGKDTILQYVDLWQLGLLLTCNIEWFYNEYYDIHIELSNEETGKYFLDNFCYDDLDIRDWALCFDFEGYATSMLNEYDIIADCAVSVWG